MTLLTRIVLILHAVIALPFVISPEWGADLLSERPKLTYYGIRLDASRQESMVYMYERIAYTMQMFLGLSGVFLAVDNWYISLALLGFDAASALALTQFLDLNPKHVDNLDKLAMFYAFGAFVGLVGLLRRLASSGLAIRRSEDKEGWVIHGQALMAVFTFGPELGLAFPQQTGLFAMSSPRFTNALLEEGKWVFELACLRILIGLGAMVVLCVGSYFARDLNIHAMHCVSHISLGVGFLAVIAARQDLWTGGHLEIPTFMHFLVGVANALNYLRGYKRKVYDILFKESVAANERLKQE